MPWRRVLLAAGFGAIAGLSAGGLIIALIPWPLSQQYFDLYLTAWVGIGFASTFHLLGRLRRADDEPDIWRADAVDLDTWTSVVSVFNPAEARLAAHALSQAEIPVRIRNENVSFLRGEIPLDDCWVEVWVPREQADEAREVLETSSSTDSDEALEPPPSPASEQARRALRAALVGIIVVPPLLHPYALSLAIYALRELPRLDPADRRRAIVAAVISLGFMALALALAWRFGPWATTTMVTVP